MRVDYCLVTPAAPLSDHVQCVWSLIGGGPGCPGDAPVPQRILPDGTTEVVFNLADPFLRHHAGGALERQPLQLFVGQMSRPVVIQPSGRVDLVGIRFRPGGMAAFLPLPLAELGNRIVALDAVVPRVYTVLAERLADTTPAARFALITDELLCQLRRARPHSVAVRATVDWLVRTSGRVAVRDLATAAGVSVRHLERQFTARVGMSPKLLGRVLRFQRAVRALGQRVPPVRVAAACGYYDQAHLIRDFHAFAGVTPTEHFGTDSIMSDQFTDVAAPHLARLVRT
jgi:AraC-like DNA-binding protein